WTPLMATPAHPSYPSNHAINSTTSALVLASFFGKDAIPFSVSWDGLPGVTRSFGSFSAGAREAGLSRIWAGFHWRFDVTVGEEMGQAIADYVFGNYLLPLRGPAPGPGGGPGRELVAVDPALSVAAFPVLAVAGSCAPVARPAAQLAPAAVPAVESCGTTTIVAAG